MNSEKSQLFFMAFGIVWVAGWGWLMYRHPEAFAKVNARFGFKLFTGPKYITFTRRLGIVEMTLAALGLISTLVTAIWGLNK